MSSFSTSQQAWKKAKEKPFGPGALFPSSLEVLLPVVKDNVLVPWSSCGSVLDKEVPSGLVVEVLSLVFGPLCCS